MDENTKEEEFQKFMEIIYDNLERVLEDRPRFPISNFANGILKDVGE